VKVSGTLLRSRWSWAALLIGLCLTAVAVAHVVAAPGVYWARSQVVLLGPVLPSSMNKLDGRSDGLVATAGLIAREMNLSGGAVPVTSNLVTLPDQGVYDGMQVRQPNSGGQWAVNFEQPVLQLQASGPSAEVVRQRIESMIAQAAAILDRRQNEADVTRSLRITLAVSPAQVQVQYSSGDRPRAAATAVLLGLSLTAASVAVLESARARRLARTRNLQGSAA
jgi:hypothetical protein